MSITLANYEEWIVAFVDGELSDAEIQTFKSFLSEHPALQEEVAAFEETIFFADETLIFDDKASLYKKTGAMVLFKKVWPLAAALVLLLALIPLLKEDKMIDTKLVSNEIKKDKTTPRTSPIQTTEVVKQKTPPEKAPEENNPTEAAIISTNTKKPNATRKKTKIVEPTIEEVKESNQENILVKSPEKPLVQEKEIQNLQKPTPIELSKEKEIVVQQEKKEPIQEPLVEEENMSGLVVISEDKHPQLFEKINKVVDQVEDKIETIKELKRAPITVSIGRRKLFTINN